MADTAPKKARVPPADAASSVELLGQPLYPLAVGVDWHKLDNALQSFHGTTALRQGAGLFDIRHGHGALARSLAWLCRMPKAGRGVPTKVVIHCEPSPRQENGIVEIWDRTFGERRLVSVQSVNAQGLLVERFDMIEMRFRLSVENGALCFEQVSAAIPAGRLRIPLPQWLAPRITARVGRSPRSENSFAVSVKLVLPFLWIGLLLSYEGHLEVAETTKS